MPKQSSTTKDNIWIAIRINDTFLNINDEPYDVYVLMNAMTAFVYGHVLAKADKPPVESDVVGLFQKAHEVDGKWPDKLIIPDSSKAREIFKSVANKYTLSLEAIPLSRLSPIIKPLTEAFAQEAEED